MPAPNPRTIGILSERSLHAALKRQFAQPSDGVEVKIDGYWIDIVRPWPVDAGEAAAPPPSPLLIEIQTSGFSAIQAKLRDLLARYRVHLIHPIATERWIVKQDADGRELGRRRSPSKGHAAHICEALVGCADLLAHANLTIETLLIREEEIRQPNDLPQKGRWWREWKSVDRRLVEICERQLYEVPGDLLGLLPTPLPDTFTSGELARAMRIPLALAQRVTYCLRHLKLISEAGRRGRAKVYALANQRMESEG